MARPKFLNGGDGLHVWRVTANKLNMSSRTADNRRSSGLGGVGVGLTTPSSKKKSVMKCLKGHPNWMELWTNDM